MRPEFVIETNGENSVLETGERRTHYGFCVRNAGRTIATGVRVQLIRVEGRRPGCELRCLLDHAFDLAPFRCETGASISASLALVPETAIGFGLATKTELDAVTFDDDLILPSVTGLPDQFEEVASGFADYRYTVVAFDDRAQFARKVIAIR